MDENERKEIRMEFANAVNMAPAEIEKWLETCESKGVGITYEGEDESVGHKSGSRIVETRRKTKGELTDEDYQHMRKVIGYVHRHLAQRPDGDVTDTRWRYSLMNWGHDPLRDE